MRHNIIILFFVILYSQGILTAFDFNPFFIGSILFLIPFILLLTSSQKIIIAPGFPFVFLYVAWSILSSLYLSESFFQALLFCSHLLMGYLVYLVVYNSNFSIKQISNINKCIFFMFFVQLPASLYEIIFIGRTESMVGLMFSGGGGPATTFTVFSFVFMFSFYLYRRQLRYLIYGLSFFIIGYASGKLGVYIFIPIIAFISLLFYKYFEKKSFFASSNLKIIFGFFSIALIISFALPYADARTSRINFNSLDPFERISIFLRYVTEGENKSYGAYYTGSRSATSIRVIEETFNRDPSVFLFGQGFKAYDAIGHTYGMGAFEEYGIVYGITGWTYDSLIYGWPIMFFHVSFYLLIFFKLYRNQRNYKYNRFWSVICFSLLVNTVTFLFNYFLYNTNYTIGGWMICVHMYFAAILLSKNYSECTSNRFSC